MSYKRLAGIVLCFVLAGCDSTPKLDTTTDKAYEQSFKAMVKALNKEEQRKLNVDLGVIATAAQNAQNKPDPAKGMGGVVAASMSPSIRYKDANGLTADQIHDKAVRIKNDRNKRN